MAQHAPKQQAPYAAGNDVTSLFSHFGDYSRRATYHEVVRQDAAINAACRWPLLAEIEGIGADPAIATIPAAATAK